jgi:two-component system, sensor histidine kinase LadS
MLDKNDFLRIHKSHIVNINFVERYIRGEGGMVIMPDGAEVSVSRTMKAELLEKLNIS